MINETVTLRCTDNAEAVVFTKYIYKAYSVDELNPIFDIDFDISIEDSYIGGDYKGLFGRFKRAWRAFIGKPVVYTGIYCEDKEKMRKFLTECLDLVNKEEPK